jgi:hypothetical protein
MKYPPMNAQIYTWDYIYRITPDIILGFKYGNPRIVEEKDMKKERGEFGYVCEQRSDRKNFRMKDEVINSRLYWLCLYKSKNLEDHFVEFRSDMTKVNRVWGAIRFPASYPLEEIEKQTTQILSGIKFEK